MVDSNAALLSGVGKPMINGSVIPTPPLAGQYRCLVVDPPWDQGYTRAARERGA